MGVWCGVVGARLRRLNHALVLSAVLASPASGAEILLRWTASAFTDEYHIYVGQASRAYSERHDVNAHGATTIGGIVYYHLSDPNLEGDRFFSVTASNSAGESAFSNEKTIEFRVADLPPFSFAGPDREVTTGQQVTLGTDGTPGTLYAWFQRGGPPIVLENPTESSTSFHALLPGVYELVLVAADARGLASSDSVIVTVTDDGGPEPPTETPIPTFTAAPSPTSVMAGLVTSTFVGGSSVEQIRDTTTDAAGNIYVTGGTTSADFPTTSGAFDRSHAGFADVFVMKISPTGELLWSTLLGGPYYDRAYAIELDPQGDVVVSGRAGAGFPTTAGVIQRTFGGDLNPEPAYGAQDGFIAKLSGDGSRLLWSTYFGGPDRGFIRDAALDSAGNVFVTMPDTFQPFPHITEGAYQIDLPNPECGVVAKLNSTASTVIWSSYLGGGVSIYGEMVNGTPSIRVGPSGEPVVVGATKRDNLPTPNGFDSTRATYTDWYIAKFRADGTGLVFATYLGGNEIDGTETHNLALDPRDESIILAGTTKSTDLPVTSGAFQFEYVGSGVGAVTGQGTNYNGDGFVARLSPTGALLAATYIGGSVGDGIEGVSVDPSGRIFVSGATYSADFPVTAGAVQANLRGAADFFAAILSPDLRQLVFATFLGGSSTDYGRASAVTADGRFVIGGEITSTDWPIRNAFQTTGPAGGGALAELNPFGPAPPTPTQTATRPPTVTRTRTPTRTASWTRTPTAAPTLTSTRTARATVTSTATRSPTRSATPSRSATPTRSATVTDSTIPTLTPAPTETLTTVPTTIEEPTFSPTPSMSPAATLFPTADDTATPDPTTTPTPSLTETMTAAATDSPELPPTETPTAPPLVPSTETVTEPATATETATSTEPPTVPPTESATPEVALTVTPEPTTDTSPSATEETRSTQVPTDTPTSPEMTPTFPPPTESPTESPSQSTVTASPSPSRSPGDNSPTTSPSPTSTPSYTPTIVTEDEPDASALPLVVVADGPPAGMVLVHYLQPPRRTTTYSFDPFAAENSAQLPHGPIVAALGDVDGDGTADLVIGEGPSSAQLTDTVRVFAVQSRQPPRLLAEFSAFDEQGFSSSGNLLVADVDVSVPGDEILVGEDGAGRRATTVRVFGDLSTGKLRLLHTVRAVPPRFARNLPLSYAVANIIDPGDESGPDILVASNRRLMAHGVMSSAATALASAPTSFDDNAVQPTLAAGNFYPQLPGDEIALALPGPEGSGLVRIFSADGRSLAELEPFTTGAVSEAPTLWASDVIRDLAGSELLVGRGTDGGEVAVYGFDTGGPQRLFELPGAQTRRTSLAAHLVAGDFIESLPGNEVAIAQPDPTAELQIYHLNERGAVQSLILPEGDLESAVAALASTH